MNKKATLFFILILFLLLLVFTNITISLLYSIFIVLFYIDIKKFRSLFYKDKNFTQLEVFSINILLSLGIFQFVWLLASLFLSGISRNIVLLVILVIPILIPKNKELDNFKKRDNETIILLILSFLLTSILYFPFSNLGKTTNNGVAYRAYFSSDYLKHFSVIEKISYSCIPPENPYFKGEKLHYYWMPYSLPSTIFIFKGDIKKVTIGWSILINSLFLLILFFLVYGIFDEKEKYKGVFSFFFTFSPILFLSYEGVYLFISKISNFKINQIWNIAKTYNIDALTRWHWHIPEINTLLRSLFYTPQHLLSLTFFVLYMLLRKKNNLNFLTTIVLLLSSIASSIFIGIGFFIVYFYNIVYEFYSEKERKNKLLKSLLITSFLTFILLIIFYLLKIIVFGERKIIIKLIPVKYWVGFFILNLGIIFVLGIIGGLKKVKTDSLFLSITTLSFIILLVRIEGFESDISLKIAMVLIILLLIATIDLVESIKFKKDILYTIIILLFLPAFITSIIDISNSSDITNKRFTFFIPKNEYLMLKWINKNIDKHTIIQDFPPARENFVSIIPSFSGFQMYIGDRMHGRIFLINEKKYNYRMKKLKSLLRNIKINKDKLKKIGIEYIFWGRKEKQYFKYVPHIKPFKRIKNVFIFKIK